MARRRHRHGYITNPTARKVSLKKRKQHILKMVEELTILCSINGCVVIYSPDEPEPTFWPSQLQVEFMLREYESIPYIAKCTKKVSIEAFLNENVNKMEKQLNSVESINREIENDNFLNQIYRAGRRFEQFQMSELIGLKEYVEDRRNVLGKRMQCHDLFICEGNELVSDEEPVEEPKNRIEDEDPAMEEWFINMTKETQYEVSSSNNSVPEKQKAVTDVIDHAAMSTDQGNEIYVDAAMSQDNGGGGYGISENGASGNHAMEIYNGNPNEGVKIGGNNKLGVVEGADKINAVMFPHENIQGSDTLNVGQCNVNMDGSINYKENDNQNLHLDPQGSVTVINHNLYGLTEGSYHGILGFPNNNYMFSAALLSSNSMNVNQPNYVSYGGENMAHHPGNH